MEAGHTWQCLQLSVQPQQRWGCVASPSFWALSWDFPRRLRTFQGNWADFQEFCFLAMWWYLALSWLWDLSVDLHSSRRTKMMQANKRTRNCQVWNLNGAELSSKSAKLLRQVIGKQLVVHASEQGVETEVHVKSFVLLRKLGLSFLLLCVWRRFRCALLWIRHDWWTDQRQQDVAKDGLRAKCNANAEFVWPPEAPSSSKKFWLCTVWRRPWSTLVVEVELGGATANFCLEIQVTSYTADWLGGTWTPALTLHQRYPSASACITMTERIFSYAKFNLDAVLFFPGRYEARVALAMYPRYQSLAVSIGSFSSALTMGSNGSFDRLAVVTKQSLLMNLHLNFLLARLLNWNI